MYSFDLILVFCHDPATTEIYTLSLHDALPILAEKSGDAGGRSPKQADILIGLAQSAALFHAPDGTGFADLDRKSTRLNSSHLGISYAVFCLKKKNKTEEKISSMETKQAVDA